MDRKEIKRKAKEFAFNNKWKIWAPLLVIYAISYAYIFILGLLITDKDSALYDVLTIGFEIAILPVSVGYTSYLYKLLKGEEISIKEALLSKYNMFGLIFVTTLLVGLFTSLWAILLIIPGIIYSFKMAMVPYILADEGSIKMTYKEVMDKSKKMMNGHKWEWFVFSLSFLGWSILCFLTLGIAMIWVMPYIIIAQIMYYQELLKLTSNAI